MEMSEEVPYFLSMPVLIPLPTSIVHNFHFLHISSSPAFILGHNLLQFSKNFLYRGAFLSMAEVS